MQARIRKLDDQDTLGLPPAAGMRVPVLLPYPFEGPFDYRLPRGMTLAPGDYVLVPLNRREEVGVVWDGVADGSVGDNKLRPVSARLDAPPIRCRKSATPPSAMRCWPSSPATSRGLPPNWPALPGCRWG